MSFLHWNEAKARFLVIWTIKTKQKKIIVQDFLELIARKSFRVKHLDLAIFLLKEFNLNIGTWTHLPNRKRIFLQKQFFLFSFIMFEGSLFPLLLWLFFFCYKKNKSEKKKKIIRVFFLCLSTRFFFCWWCGMNLNWK